MELVELGLELADDGLGRRERAGTVRELRDPEVEQLRQEAPRGDSTITVAGLMSRWTMLARCAV